MSFPTFNGAAGEDAQEFLDNLEIACLITGRDGDATRLRVFPLLMKAEAKFVELWERWVASLRLGEAAPDFPKKDRFLARLCPPLRQKVKGRFPVTWMDARDIARLKERKIRYQLQQRKADQEEEGMAPVPPTNAPAAHRGQGNQDQQELLSRITHQLEDLSVHLVQGGRGPPQNQEQARGPRRQAQEYHCYNLGENGHDAKVKVEEEEKGKSLPKDKGKAKVEDVDAMPIKRARQEEVAMSETGEKRKSKENKESSSKKKPKPRQKITIKDFALATQRGKKGKAIHIDLKDGKHESLDLETSVDEFSSSDYSTSEEESTITDENNSSQVEIMGVVLTNPTMIKLGSPQVDQVKEVVLLRKTRFPFLEGAYTITLNRAAIKIAVTYNEKGTKLFGMSLVVDRTLVDTGNDVDVFDVNPNKDYDYGDAYSEGMLDDDQFMTATCDRVCYDDAMEK
ncbi:hypothetical protein L7F22_001446 [Adiantum nelumboides]|nr:hypothetical protein [Adiantum nelumboides]